MPDFPPVLVLNVREHAHRKRHTAAMFERQGIVPRWVDGVNGHTIGLVAAYPHDWDSNGKREYLHPGRIGNCLSQVIAHKIANYCGYDEFFIMEDDVVLADNFQDEWAKVRISMPDGIQVVQCAYNCHEDKEQEPINEHLEHRYHPFCSTCNWWSKAGSDIALRIMYPINSPVDILYAQKVFPFCNHAITIPQLAWDHSGWGKEGKWPSVKG